MTIEKKSKKAWNAPTIVDLDSKFSQMMTKSAKADTEVTITVSTDPLVTLGANS
jgi:hypothetical protein